MKTSFAEVNLGALLLRQISAGMQRGATLSQATADIRTRLPEALRPRLDALVTSIERPADEPLGRKHTAFESVAQLAKRHGASVVNAMLRLGHHAERLVPVDERVDQQFSSRIAYAVGVGTVALLLTVIMYFYVAPMFDAFFSGAGDGESRLPGLTRWLYVSGNGVMSWLVVAVLVVPALIWGMFARHVRRAIRTMTPLPHYWQRVPLVGRTARRTGHVVTVLVADSLYAGGLTPTAALDAATSGALAPAHTMGEDELPEVIGLALARDNLSLEAELRWQTEVADELFLAEVDALVTRMSGVLTGLAGVVVGLRGAAFYLPVFMMGRISAAM